MNTGNALITVSGVDAEVIYKSIKHIHISVYPPDGRVRVAAPHRIDDEAVRLAIIQRLPWIRNQQVRLRNAPRQSERQMVSGKPTTCGVSDSCSMSPALGVMRSRFVDGRSGWWRPRERAARRAGGCLSAGTGGNWKPPCHRCWKSGSRSWASR